MVAVVSAAALWTPAADDEESYTGARSPPASLLHPQKAAVSSSVLHSMVAVA
jgi:hypothetical protein